MTRNGDDGMRRSVVCGVDGSAGARRALRVAAALADELRARLVVAHVVQPQLAVARGPAADQPATLPMEALLEAGNALLDRIGAEEQLANVERRVVLGFASDRLADLADDEDAELIVVGSRGRRGFKAAWLGSVSADLIGVARCPVLVVPPAMSAARDERLGSVGAGKGSRSRDVA